jgi:hypothetical protein
MHSSAWAAVFRHIPAEQQNEFSVVTAAGTEISVASLLRVEEDFVVIKGRLSGSQDAGRVFFLPYANIDYLGYTNPVKDEDFEALFGSFEAPRPRRAVEVPVAVSPSAQGLPGGRPSSLGPAPLARPSTIDRPAIRSEVLERFRSRPAQP